MMVPPHHELNIAFKGQHYARVKFPDLLDEKTVKQRANAIKKSMMSKFSPPDNWSFTLIKVNCYGEEVSF